ncbi:MAG: hypothetical protein AMK73_04280 [Planctomycetes bacterium SM23_32]|nr:MAG: hypothetical protein AMK73_04280 [Planctomycetes bacterium SM23_32]
MSNEDHVAEGRPQGRTPRGGKDLAVTDRPTETWRVLDDLSDRVRTRREMAETSGDQAEAVRLRAMESVLHARPLALACPDAVVVAGDAALAAHDGQSEPEWYASAYARRRGIPCEQTQLNVAVRLLKSADLWPWGRRRGGLPPRRFIP